MTVERAQRAIDKMATGRRDLIAWIRSVPAEDWTKLSPEGIWQARDYVAHLASIDPLLVGIVRGFQRQADSPPPSDAVRQFSIDDWNEGQIMERRKRSIEELIAEMESHRTSLSAAMADFTDEQLDRTFHFGGDKSRSPRDTTVAEFLRGLGYHDRWHMEDAHRAIEGESEQPFGDNAFNKMLTTDPPATA